MSAASKGFRTEAAGVRAEPDRLFALATVRSDAAPDGGLLYDNLLALPPRSGNPVRFRGAELRDLHGDTVRRVEDDP